jgi:hypothetical protein
MKGVLLGDSTQMLGRFQPGVSTLLVYKWWEIAGYLNIQNETILCALLTYEIFQNTSVSHPKIKANIYSKCDKETCDLEDWYVITDLKYKIGFPVSISIFLFVR